MFHTTKNDEQSKSDTSVVPVSSSPEVNPKRPRRRFTAGYKLKVLEELDHCTVVGEKGSILRREGLYSSQISDWRQQRDAGALSALNKMRGRKKKIDSKSEEIKALEDELLQLKSKLAQAETIIDIQKKVSEIFGSRNPTNENNGSSS